MEAARPHGDAASVSASLGERHLLQIHQVLATICEGSPKLRRSNGEWGRTPASAATVDAKERPLLGPWLVWLVLQIAAQLCMFVVPRAGTKKQANTPVLKKSGGILLVKLRHLQLSNKHK
jgi:hypothetical protein